MLRSAPYGHIYAGQLCYDRIREFLFRFLGKPHSSEPAPDFADSASNLRYFMMIFRCLPCIRPAILATSRPIFAPFHLAISYLRYSHTSRYVDLQDYAGRLPIIDIATSAAISLRAFFASAACCCVDFFRFRAIFASAAAPHFTSSL